jgi:acyl-CoA synthetase (AMP-forming)/AMP-acid ligase II
MSRVASSIEIPEGSHASQAKSVATLSALLRARAYERAEHKFFVCDDGPLTFAEAQRQSASFAKGLLQLGAGKGTRVGLVFPNSREFVVLFLAAVRIGAVAVPLSTLCTPDELRWQISNADVEVLLCTSSYRSRNFVEVLSQTFANLRLADSPRLMMADAPSLRRIFMSCAAGVSPQWSMQSLLDGGRVVSDEFMRSSEDSVDPADFAVIVHTSGSLSVPKGVLHTHGGIVDHLSNLRKIRKFSGADVLFSNAPFFWIGGLIYCLLGALEAGATLLCSAAQSAEATLDLIEAERPTIVTGFPQSVAHLLKAESYPRRDFSSVQRGNMPGIMAPDKRPADPELRHNILGMTETASVYLIDEYDGPLPERLRGSFGKPAPGFEIEIVDPVSSERMAAGQVGEIRVRGPYIMQGYLGRERRDTFESDGWYRTGDLAYRNEEGFVFYKGRWGDMIKTSGANVSPREVEDVLGALTGRRVHVLGVADADRDQIVAAVVVVEAGARIDETELRQELKKKLSSYKIPRRILFLTEGQVPMMSSGKLDKRKLAEMFRAT